MRLLIECYFQGLVKLTKVAKVKHACFLNTAPKLQLFWTHQDVWCVNMHAKVIECMEFKTCVLTVCIKPHGDSKWLDHNYSVSVQ